MSVYKRKYGSGKVAWCYAFDAPWSTPERREQIKQSGFKTKKEAEGAEARRRMEVLAEADDRKKIKPTGLPETLKNQLVKLRETSRDLTAAQSQAVVAAFLHPSITVNFLLVFAVLSIIYPLYQLRPCLIDRCGSALSGQAASA